MATATNNKVEMVASRPAEEVEGSLLPPPIQLPTATALATTTTATTDDTTTAAALAAVPLSSFAYTAEVVNNDTKDQTEREQRLQNGRDVETAPFLPTYEECSEERRQTNERIGLAIGKEKGRILSDYEREQIRKQNLEVNPINYHNDKNIEQAKRIAKQRNRSGVQIKEDKWFGNEEKATAPMEDSDQTTYSNNKTPSSGYDVSEYNTTDYNSGYEYKTTEYKSVYDN